MKLYNDIENAIRQQRNSLKLNKESTHNEVKLTLRQVLRDNPDIFWFAHNASYNEQAKVLSLGYLFSAERVKLLKASISDVVNNDFQIDKVRELSVSEQVMYVYQWIISYCNYNINSAFNQEIDSVFVRRNSVCTGYAKTAQYLFHLLGIESILVFGKLHKDTSLKGRHCWNMVKIHNTYYHLDVSLGDPINAHLLKDEPHLYKGCIYNCYCVSTDEILKSRSIEQIETIPKCSTSLPPTKQVSIFKRKSRRGCLLSPIGSSADIYLCTTDKHTVFKQFRKDSVTSCSFEYEIMKRLIGCRHTIQLNEQETDVDNDILAIEQSTPLLDLFLSRDFKFNVTSLLRMARDIVIAWVECRSRGVIYRDIHPCNIYRTNEGVYILGDFGSCTTDFNAKERVGNEWFMSPTIYWGHERFNEQSAIYSITMVMYFILNGLQPAFWSKQNEQYALQSRLSNRKLPLPRLLHDTSYIKPLLELIYMGYNNDIQAISDFISLIEYTYAFYSTNDIKLKFAQSDFKFEGSFNTTEIICSTTHVATNIDGIEHCCSTASDLLTIDNYNENQVVDDIEDYCRTQGAPPAVPPVSIQKDVTYEPSSQGYDDKTYTLKKRNGKISRFGSMISRIVLAPLSAISAGLSGLFHTFTKSKTAPKIDCTMLDQVFSSIFAPSEVKRQSHLLVQVYLHLFEETEKVKAIAIESQKDTERRDYVPLQCKLNNGDKVDVLINIYGESLVFTETKSLIWRGSFTKCTFDYFVAQDIDADELSCMAIITTNEIPIGEMHFVTQIVNNPRHLNTKIVARQFKKVFISYSHKDEEKVKAFHKGLELSGIEHFFDRAYLKAGDVFPKVIRDYINSADLFVLFWSKNASNSEYVENERKQALQRAFPQVKPQDLAKLTIYPISIEPRTDLPDDMKDNYHFGVI